MPRLDWELNVCKVSDTDLVWNKWRYIHVTSLPLQQTPFPLIKNNEAQVLRKMQMLWWETRCQINLAVDLQDCDRNVWLV